MKGLSVVFTILLFVVAVALSGFLKKANALPLESQSTELQRQNVLSSGEDTSRAVLANRTQDPN